MVISSHSITLYFTVNGVDITPYILNFEIGKTNIIQGVVTLTESHNLVIKPGYMVQTNIPFANKLIVQTINSNRITLGCFLAVYRDAAPSNPKKSVSINAGEAISAILQDRGIPQSAIQVSLDVKLGQSVSLGDDPEEIALACGYILQSDFNNSISLVPASKQTTKIGSFNKGEIIEVSLNNQNPISSNRVIAEGVLSKVEESDVEWESETKTIVRGGFRTITKKYKVSRDKTIETEIIKEPKSQVSTFASNYGQNKSDPGQLLVGFFSSSGSSPAVKSQTKTVTTNFDRDGYMESRVTLVHGMAAKGLSKYYAAWASAEAPPEEETPEEPEYVWEEITPRSGSYGSSVWGYVPVEPSPFGADSTPLTIIRPSGMFHNIDLELIKESWDYDIPDEKNPITDLGATSASFNKNRGKVVYQRLRFLPIGAILPEMGNPLFGYQEVTQESSPIYRPGDRMTLAEKELVIYEQEESGEWIAERTLEQAIGIRNAQEPLDAMKAVQFPEGSPAVSRQDRGDVALNVATQVTLAAQSRQRSSPPGPTDLKEDVPYSLTRDFRFELEFSSEDLLDRTTRVSPRAYSPGVEAIVNNLEYQAQETLGRSKAITIKVPYNILSFDIPHRALIEYDNTLYSVISVKVNSDHKSSTLDLLCYPKI